MLSLNPMKELYESPLPPMALTDYEAFSKFLNQALHRCRETGRDFNVYLDWAIRALASSLAADSAARIFLPKTRTAPFSLDDLIPPLGAPLQGDRAGRLEEDLCGGSGLEQHGPHGGCGGFLR